MAKEAIQAVRDAENRAHQLIEEAKEKGEQEIQERRSSPRGSTSASKRSDGSGRALETGGDGERRI